MSEAPRGPERKPSIAARLADVRERFKAALLRTDEQTPDHTPQEVRAVIYEAQELALEAFAATATETWETLSRQERKGLIRGVEWYGMKLSDSYKMEVRRDVFPARLDPGTRKLVTEEEWTIGIGAVAPIPHDSFTFQLFVINFSTRDDRPAIYSIKPERFAKDSFLLSRAVQNFKKAHGL